MSKTQYYKMTHDAKVWRDKLKDMRTISRKIEAKILKIQNVKIQTSKDRFTIQQYNELLREIEHITSKFNYLYSSLELELKAVNTVCTILQSNQIS